HHVGKASVAAKDRRRAGFLGHLDHLAELDDGLAARQGVGGNRRCGERRRPRQIALGRPDRYLDRIAILAAMRITDGNAAEQHLDGVVDVALLDSEELQSILVDRDAQGGRGSPIESSTSTMNGTELKIFLTSPATARRVAESGP